MISKKDISSIPIEGDISFREQKIDKNNTALLVIDLQKGEYNPEIISKKPDDKYMWERIKNIGRSSTFRTGKEYLFES